MFSRYFLALHKISAIKHRRLGLGFYNCYLFILSINIDKLRTGNHFYSIGVPTIKHMQSIIAYA